MALSNVKVIFLILGFLATIQLAMQIPAVLLPPLKSNTDIQSSNVESINTLLENLDNDSENSILHELNMDSIGNVKKNLYLNWWIKTPAQKLIDSVPEEDRGHFIIYHLSEGLNTYSIKPRIQIVLPNDAGIPYDKYEEFQNITTYEQFSKDLLGWTKVILATDNVGINNFVRTRSACPPWGCFDPNDIGQMCCPF